MPLHPEALEFLRGIHESGNPPLIECSPVEARAMSAGLGAAIGPGPEIEKVSDLEIPVDGAQIAARRYEPADARGTILWLHGGGWVLDGLEPSDAMCRILAESSGATVYSVDYRVAPEHPFPVAVDDSWTALE